MSWKPSFTFGSLKRDLNPLKAILGSAVRDSGLSWIESATVVYVQFELDLLIHS